MPTIEIDGQAIHYLTGSSGVAPERRTIVFVHGAGGNGLIWRGQIRGLDRGVNTICPDLPGHGGSAGKGYDDIEAYSCWLLNFIKGLGLHRVILAGHSMGSAVVIETALQAPEISEALVLIGGGARLRVSHMLLQGLETDFEATVKEVTELCYGSGGSYIAADGSDNGDTAVWQTDSQWGTTTATGLSETTEYAFCVKARNGDSTETGSSLYLPLQ